MICCYNALASNLDRHTKRQTRMNSTNRTLWILSAGFVLVILTLSLLAWLGFRQAASIRQQASKLANEHLFTAHLVDDLELESHRASTLLLTFSRADQLASRPSSLQLLTDFESAMPEIIQSGNQLMPHPSWAQLRTATEAYAAAVRAAVQRSVRDAATMTTLHQRYDEFVHQADQVIKLDLMRAAEIENRIETESRNLASETGGLLVGALTLSLICAVITIRFTVGSLRRIEWQGQQLNRVSWHLIQGQEEAARRFSHEMHDELGQSLTGLKAMLSAMPPAEFDARRGECLRLLDESIGNVRELSQLLRPVILDDFGLVAAMRWLAERFQMRTRIIVEVETTFTERLEEDIETHLFRITQEALTNIARHAGANHAMIRLEQEGENICLTITDNGIGIPKQSRTNPSLGLVGMRARAEQLGGTFTLENNPAGGVRALVCVPARWTPAQH